MANWRLHKIFWDQFAIIKYRGNKPLEILIPEGPRQALKAVPLATHFPGIPVRTAKLADRIPADESKWGRRIFFRFQVWLYRAFSPMLEGMPEIDADPRKALREAFTRGHRKQFREPALPKEYETASDPDLGLLALRSPFACYLERTRDGKLHWDLMELDGYEVHPELMRLGVRVLFESNGRRGLRATHIETGGKTVSPRDKDWARAKAVALCAVTTHVSLVRHFNWVHLACGEPFAIASRNAFKPGHPLLRLLWPHFYGTQQSNWMVTLGQMAPGGDFDSIFSFTHQGLCRLFDDTFPRYRATVIVPSLDWKVRGLEGLNLDAPVQQNLTELYELLRRHAESYLAIYYENDRALAQDTEIAEWLRQLNSLIPNGIDQIMQHKLTREGLATLIGGFLYMATVQHEALGAGLWDYQMWVHKHPIRVYQDGRRIPLDVYSRLVNANFILNAHRTPLVQDFSKLAVGGGAKWEQAKRQFQAFHEELKTLDAKLGALPRAEWRVLPRHLYAHINA
jgi:arachidonate 15-lipoxygenase